MTIITKNKIPCVKNYTFVWYNQLFSCLKEKNISSKVLFVNIICSFPYVIFLLKFPQPYRQMFRLLSWALLCYTHATLRHVIIKLVPYYISINILRIQGHTSNILTSFPFWHIHYLCYNTTINIVLHLRIFVWINFRIE